MTNDASRAETMTKAPHRKARRNLADRFGFWVFVAMVVLAPVPDGSVAQIWVQLWTAFAAVAVLFLSHRDVPRGVLLLMLGLVIVIAGYGVVAWLQSISPGPAPLAIWSDASTLLGMEIPPLSSSVRDAPIGFLGRPLLAALVLIGAMLAGTDRERAAALAKAIVSAACVYGFIGLAGLVLDLSELRPFDQGAALTTFFLNKNTTATYLGSAFLVVFALLLPRALRLVRDRNPLSHVFRGDGARGRLALGGAGIFLIALLPLTLSRAGLMLTLFMMLAAITPRLKFRKGRRTFWRLCFGILVFLTFIYALSGQAWRERQARFGFDSLGRLDAYEQMLNAAQAHPWLGLGLGSFAQSFAQFRTADLGLAGVFDIGHSTPIELIFEGGYPLALLVFAYVLICAAVLVRGALRRPSDPFILAALLVGGLGLVHTSFDFSLQIPGYLVVYLAVVGVGLARSFLPREVKTILKRKERRLIGPAAEPSPTAGVTT